MKKNDNRENLISLNISYLKKNSTYRFEIKWKQAQIIDHQD